MPSMTTYFKFSPLDRIVDPFGNPGIVDTCGVNQTRGRIYLVYTEKDPINMVWYAEDLFRFELTRSDQGHKGAFTDSQSFTNFFCSDNFSHFSDLLLI